jgi:hypothetical protein
LPLGEPARLPVGPQQVIGHGDHLEAVLQPRRLDRLGGAQAQVRPRRPPPLGRGDHQWPAPPGLASAPSAARLRSALSVKRSKEVVPACRKTYRKLALDLKNRGECGSCGQGSSTRSATGLLPAASSVLSTRHMVLKRIMDDSSFLQGCERKA